MSLASMTTLGIGGRARYFVRAETEEQVAVAVKFANVNDLDLFVLGGGSNVLISDSGFDGLVLQIALAGIRNLSLPAQNSESEAVIGTEKHGSHTVPLSVAAGEDWDSFVCHCVADDLAGVECLSGIPGLVGGTPIQNVGAYGQEVAETIRSVRCLDRRTGDFIEMSNTECGFAYRKSIFNSTHRDRFIVVSVVFALKPGGAPKLAYKDLADYFGTQTPSLREIRAAILKIRRAKSMVIDADDPNSRSAGSFFKNPIVSEDVLKKIAILMGDVPSFKVGDRYKIPAAWLIENAGFEKGYALGEAGISQNHTLALINRGHAMAEEIVRLKDEIQTAVSGKFNIELVPEPICIGFGR